MSAASSNFNKLKIGKYTNQTKYTSVFICPKITIAGVTGWLPIQPNKLTVTKKNQIEI